MENEEIIVPVVEEDEAEKGTEENPFTREEAIAAGIDVEKAEAEAEPLEESAPE